MENFLVYLSTKKILVLFLFFFSILLGHAYIMYKHYDFSHSVPDTQSYIRMAEGDFATNPTHRYRPIIPLTVFVVNSVVEKGFSAILSKQAEQNSTKSIQFCFFIVNTVLMAFWAVLLYLIARKYTSKILIAVVVVSLVLSSQWAAYIAGLPLVDSLYLLLSTLLVLGYLDKNYTYISVAVLIGAISKEAFLLFLPLVLLYDYKLKTWLLLASSIVVFWCNKGVIDYCIDKPTNESIDNILRHQENIMFTMKHLFSLKGMGDMLQVWGLASILIPLSLLDRKYTKSVLNSVDWFLVGFVVMVGVQMLISGVPGRMLYIASPVFVIVMVRLLEYYSKEWK